MKVRLTFNPLLVFSLCSLVWGGSLPALAAGRQLTGPYAPAASPALAPAEAQAKFVVPPGFAVRLFAAEPDVVNPVAMTWDARGRLWVLELYEYPLGAPAGTRPRDRIKILEDTDNDGRADKVTVFADGLNLATGMVLGDGGVYVGQAPDFLFLQDTNHDDVADTRTVLLTGFGLEDRHELLNGFTWGPDGYLYLTHGVFTHSRVKIPEASAPGVEVTAAVARYHPRTKRFEVFADGTSNPWGVDFDGSGNAFVSACVIDHLFHMAPGGIYARQGGTPANPYAYELLPSIVDHRHHMAAYCGVCIYQGDQFPEEYRGRVFMGNIHQNAINQDRLTPVGSSFKAAAEKDFLTTSDGWFRPVSEQVGPDGALWIADWYDKYPCYQNAQADPEGVDRERGRIWRVVSTARGGDKLGSRPSKDLDLGGLATDALVKLLEHPNVWQRRTAQRLLTERRDASAAPLLRRLVQPGKDREARLAALWTLHSSDQLEDATLDEIQRDIDSSLRAWAARLTGERDASEPALARLNVLASDAAAPVRLAVAVAARQFVSGALTVDVPARTPNTDTGPILALLTAASGNAKDPLLPFMIWMAGEPAFAAEPGRVLDWLAQNGAGLLPLSARLTAKAMRRLCDTQSSEKIEQAVSYLGRVSEAPADSPLALAALEGLIEGQRGKALVPKINLEKMFASLSTNADQQVRERGRQLGTLWGDATSIRATLDTIKDRRLPPAQRMAAMESARQLRSDASRDAVMSVATGQEPEPVVMAAVRALGEIGGDSVAPGLIRGWKTFTPAARAAAAEVLVSRRAWALALLAEIEAKRIAAMELPPTAIRSLGNTKDEAIRERAAAVLGRIRPANTDKQAIIEAKKAMILAGPAPDLKAGHELARKTCLVCHKLFGEGAEVGPDLTGVGRSSLDALLANVIDPSQVIGAGYENVEVETKDGRSLSGRLAENTDTRIKLLSSGPREDVVAKADIASMRVGQVSVMPEGLEQMPDADFRNLILYVLGH